MDKKDYRISIIVPVYNSEQYLPECIESILRQSFRDFELILVNDGSEDGSEAVCRSYDDDRVRVFSQPNRGVSAARNRGLDEARGEWVVFVDSDDWLAENALEVLMGQPRVADLTFFGSLFHSKDSVARAYMPDNHFYTDRDEAQRGLVNLLFNPRHPDYVGFTWNKMFRRDIIREHDIRFIEGLAIREDEAFTYSYASHCRTLATLPALLYNYRVQQTGLTFSRKTPDEYIMLGEAYEAAWKQFDHVPLLNYLAQSGCQFYFLAMRRSKDAVTMDKALARFWNLWRSARPSMRFHGLYKLVMQLDSEWALKAFFRLRLMF